MTRIGRRRGGFLTRERLHPRLDDFLDFASLELRAFFETALFVRELADFIRVNALESFLQLVPLLEQRDIRGAELVEFRFLDRSIHAEKPCAITLRVKGQVFRRDFFL